MPMERPPDCRWSSLPAPSAVTSRVGRGTTGSGRVRVRVAGVAAVTGHAGAPATEGSLVSMAGGGEAGSTRASPGRTLERGSAGASAPDRELGEATRSGRSSRSAASRSCVDLWRADELRGAASAEGAATGTGVATGATAGAPIGGSGTGSGGGGKGAGGAAGGGGVVTLRGGSRDSGSTYTSPAVRIPRWTYGTSCSGVPDGPGSASGSPSRTESPRCTSSGPRWVSETLKPSDVSIVTVRPCVGTLPANVTSPSAGARTDTASPSAMSTPRCWPPAYGSSPTEKPRSTSPSVGQAQAGAAGAVTSAQTTTTSSAAAAVVARCRNTDRR